MWGCGRRFWVSWSPRRQTGVLTETAGPLSVGSCVCFSWLAGVNSRFSPWVMPHRCCHLLRCSHCPLTSQGQLLPAVPGVLGCVPVLLRAARPAWGFQGHPELCRLRLCSSRGSGAPSVEDGAGKPELGPACRQSGLQGPCLDRPLGVSEGRAHPPPGRGSVWVPCSRPFPVPQGRNPALRCSYPCAPSPECSRPAGHTGQPCGPDAAGRWLGSGHLRVSGCRRPLSTGRAGVPERCFPSHVQTDVTSSSLCSYVSDSACSWVCAFHLFLIYRDPLKIMQLLS